MIMDTPLFTWLAVVALFMAALVIRLVTAVRHNHDNHVRHRHVVEFGSESEEFFAPGDPLKSDDHYYDDYE